MKNAIQLTVIALAVAACGSGGDDTPANLQPTEVNAIVQTPVGCRRIPGTNTNFTLRESTSVMIYNTRSQQFFNNTATLRGQAPWVYDFSRNGYRSELVQLNDQVSGERYTYTDTSTDTTRRYTSTTIVKITALGEVLSYVRTGVDTLNGRVVFTWTCGPDIQVTTTPPPTTTAPVAGPTPAPAPVAAPTPAPAPNPAPAPAPGPTMLADMNLPVTKALTCRGPGIWPATVTIYADGSYYQSGQYGSPTGQLSGEMTGNGDGWYLDQTQTSPLGANGLQWHFDQSGNFASMRNLGRSGSYNCN